jgi:hypothetical protein
MNQLFRYKIRYGESSLSIMMALLVIILTVAPAFAEAKNNDAPQFDAKPFSHTNAKPSFAIQRVDYRRDHNKQYRYGDHYRAYKKKYRGNNNYPNKYYYPPHQYKHQHRINKNHDGYGYKHRQDYKPLRSQRFHSGLERNYWNGHKRYGYQHKRIANQHYYYNNRGFYFPGLGTIAHGHRHHAGCEDWHFSALLASSILLSIYNK